jgi:hypothetical protein
VSDLLTVAEAAAVAGVDQANVRRWMRDGVPTGRGRRSRRVRLFAVGGKVDPTALAAVVALKNAVNAERDEPTGVLLQRASGNTKLGEAAATYVARQSCPADCRFRGAGCYAEFDNTGTHWRRASRGGEGLTPLRLAENEAALIRRTPADRHLRLHVAGDSATDEGTRVLAAACMNYMYRGGQFVWTYTHAFRTVDRSAWGSVSVLASCESADDVRDAWGRGYAAALTVDLFHSRRAYTMDGVRVVPCPAQTAGRTCTDCRLCFDDARLRDRRLVIGFETHGSGKGYADAALARRVALPVTT